MEAIKPLSLPQSNFVSLSGNASITSSSCELSFEESSQEKRLRLREIEETFRSICSDILTPHNASPSHDNMISSAHASHDVFDDTKSNSRENGLLHPVLEATTRTTAFICDGKKAFHGSVAAATNQEWHKWEQDHFQRRPSTKSKPSRVLLPKEQLKRGKPMDTTISATSSVSVGVQLDGNSARKTTQRTLMLRKQKPDSTLKVETLDGNQFATIVPASARRSSSYVRAVRDAADGTELCYISQTMQNGIHRYKIFGRKPIYANQPRSRETGYYTYADVKNVGGISGVRFAMTLRRNVKAENQVEQNETNSDPQSSTPSTLYTADFFGPSVFMLGRGHPRGFLVRNDAGKKCAKFVRLGAGNNEAIAVTVSSKESDKTNNSHATLLLFCFAAIIEEMVNKRMR
eukprot:CAMPEP_0178804382 /NCGR_PEP_ID=MMETSP0745-20121128/15049_1 /TAXON_ID=913974 /ORGANISM="Nitzschia punctata, Strain CCMP561" /LENGTH=402 /DNA_ID=CAMNT_0020463677 /DNA_START=25 /DNA_END=1233 /DNA_ORIENTATION=-